MSKQQSASGHPSSALIPGRDKRRSCSCSALIWRSLFLMGEIITGRLQSALWTQFVLLSISCCHKLQSDYHSGHQVVSLLCDKGSVKGNSTKEVLGPYILSLVHTRMGSMSFCMQCVFNPMNNRRHLWTFLSSWHVFHIPGNRCVCCPKWVMHQTLDSNMPVNYTISQ